MKMIKNWTAALLIVTFLASPVLLRAEETKAPKLKPYTLTTCIVTGDKLDSMGKPYVMEYEGREIKLCCKSCVKTFKKDPAKYIKKIEEAEKEAQKKAK